MSISELNQTCSLPNDFQLSGSFEQQWVRLGNAPAWASTERSIKYATSGQPSKQDLTEIKMLAGLQEIADVKGLCVDILVKYEVMETARQYLHIDSNYVDIYLFQNRVI